MPLELKRSVAVLDGICEIGDAESLLTWLQANPDAKVDLTTCDHLHTAILQVLLAARPTIVGADASSNLRTWLPPLFQSAQGVEL